MAKRALVAILGIGFGYRLLFIAKSQLRTDELMQALVVRSDSVTALFDRLRGGGILATPLDPLIQRAIVFLASESVWALRFHAAILGVLSIWICFRIAQFLFGDRVALYTAALMALYPLHHHFSQEGLPYALCTFLALLSYDLLLRLYFRSYRGWMPWLALAAVEAALLYSSPSGIAVLISQCGGLVLAFFWNGKRSTAGEKGIDEIRGRSLSGSEGTTALAFAVCAVVALALFWPWIHSVWTGRSLARPEILNFKLALRLLKELGDGSYPVTGVLILGAATGISALLRHGRIKLLAWLASWFVIPPGVVFLLDRWAGDSLSIGQILACTPPLLLAAGYGMSYIGERLTILAQLPSQLSSPALVYAAVFAIGSVAVAQSHWRKMPVDWQGTAQYLQGTLRTGDSLVIPSGAPLLEYYAPRLGEFRSGETPSGRHFVVCLNSLNPDPCPRVRGERTWNVREFVGLTVFTRQ